MESALKRDGKKLYELGRQGMSEEDIEIEPRTVMIYQLDLIRLAEGEEAENDKDDDGSGENGDGPISKFGLYVECGGGTYIRSLVRDIGIALGTVATMTSLQRTKQGQFKLEHCIPQSEWQGGQQRKRRGDITSSGEKNDGNQVSHDVGIEEEGVGNSDIDCIWNAIRTTRQRLSLLEQQDDNE